MLSAVNDVAVTAGLAAWTAGFTAYLSYRQSRLTAKQIETKNRYDSQDLRIKQLEDDNKALSLAVERERQFRITQQEYVAALRLIMIAHQLDPPPLPPTPNLEYWKWSSQ